MLYSGLSVLILNSNKGSTIRALSRRMALLLLVGGGAAGCLRSNSTATVDGTNKQRIYVLDDDDAVGIARGAIVRSFPGRKIDTKLIMD
jgi:hypothetical protein